jgi:CBS domain-containing protein
VLGSVTVQIHEIMTQSVVTASPESPVQAIATLMRDRNVGSVVLVDGSGRPVGMVTDRDLTIDALADAADPATPASRCATTPVVMEENTLVGIVTLDDIAVRTGNLEVAQQMTADVARAALPEFYFHQRGG